jgi:hypothetical protein
MLALGTDLRSFVVRDPQVDFITNFWWKAAKKAEIS